MTALTAAVCIHHPYTRAVALEHPSPVLVRSVPASGAPRIGEPGPKGP